MIPSVGNNAAVRAIGGIRGDLDRLFSPPRTLPNSETRARKTIDQIDWTRDTIIIWVPGTSGVGVDTRILGALRKQTRNPNIAAIDYIASWRLRESVPDGEDALRAVLDEIRRRKKPGQKLILLGESQGAWIISSVLMDPTYNKLVHRAGLISHPGLAPAHAHETRDGKPSLPTKTVREFNSVTDFVTRDLGEYAEAAERVVDAFARLEIGKAVLGAAAITMRAPELLGGLVSSQLFRVQGRQSEHTSQDLLNDAVTWALG